MDPWGGGGLADVSEDSGDGLRVGEERDEGERRLAGRTDQREDFKGPGQPVEGERGPGAVANEALEAGAVRDRPRSLALLEKHATEENPLVAVMGRRTHPRHAVAPVKPTGSGPRKGH